MQAIPLLQSIIVRHQGGFFSKTTANASPDNTLDYYD
jgi:hypothetical protein